MGGYFDVGGVQDTHKGHPHGKGEGGLLKCRRLFRRDGFLIGVGNVG